MRTDVARLRNNARRWSTTSRGQGPVGDVKGIHRDARAGRAAPDDVRGEASLEDCPRYLHAERSLSTVDTDVRSCTQVGRSWDLATPRWRVLPSQG